MAKPEPVPHPGELLHEELQARGWSQADLARAAGLSSKHVSQVVRGRSGIGTIAAQRIGDVLGISARTLIRAQAEFDIAHGRQRSRH